MRAGGHTAGIWHRMVNIPVCAFDARAAEIHPFVSQRSLRSLQVSTQPTFPSWRSYFQSSYGPPPWDSNDSVIWQNTLTGTSISAMIMFKSIIKAEHVAWFPRGVISLYKFVQFVRAVKYPCTCSPLCLFVQITMGKMDGTSTMYGWFFFAYRTRQGSLDVDERIRLGIFEWFISAGGRGGKWSLQIYIYIYI